MKIKIIALCLAAAAANMVAGGALASRAVPTDCPKADVVANTAQEDTADQTFTVTYSGSTGSLTFGDYIPSNGAHAITDLLGASINSNSGLTCHYATKYFDQVQQKNVTGIALLEFSANS